MTNETEFDLSSILDGTLDALADAPTYEPFHPGSHRALLKFEGYKGKTIVINKMPFIAAKFTLVETVELNDSSLTPQVPGSTSDAMFNMANEYGQGDLKNVLAPLAAHFNTPNNRATMEAAEGAEVLIITDVRVDSKNKDKKYLQIKEISVI